MGLPLGDWQFWLVTATVAVVALGAARRIRRALRADSEAACASCPKVAPATPGGGAAKDRLRVLPAVALAALAGAGEPLRAAAVERQVAAMGTTLRVEVEVAADRAAALAVAEETIREVEATEARLSTWREGSELSALNATPVGAWREVSPALYGDLRSALDCAAATGGAFDPTVGALAAAWGLRHGGRVPGRDELITARARTGWAGIELRAAPHRVRRRFDLRIDEGGFGKGIALDRALERARARDARVHASLGGQSAWSGGRAPVRLLLADPRERARAVAEIALDLTRGSVATSGASERRFEAGGRSFGHLLDPRTGVPAADFGSVAVAAASAFEADCLSTALFVLGPEAGLALLERSPRAAEALYLVVTRSGLVARTTPGLAGRLRPLVADLVVEGGAGSS
jgi:thiamine biosynthesis lipoprotein